MLSLHRGVGVCEDDGQNSYDRHSGLAATDGMWRHIAVTWRSDTGRAILYENGRKVCSCFVVLPIESAVLRACIQTLLTSHWNMASHVYHLALLTQGKPSCMRMSVRCCVLLVI